MTSTPLVSLFIPSLVVGGAERVALNLSQALVERGLNVDLVLQNEMGAFLAQVAPHVRVIDLNSPGIASKFLALMRYLKREQPTVLLSILDNINVAGWAQRLARVPTRVIVSLHINLSQQPPGIRTQLKPSVIRYSYGLADEVVAVSQAVAEDLAALSGLPLENIRVIYNPVITDTILQRSQEPVSCNWFAPQSPPVILGVGRLAREKDFLTLIHAFALVRQQGAARLIILGEGDERSRLETLVQKLGLESDVSLPGFIDNPYAYMARSAVFALSSTTEAFGNVVVEAMAVGTPVVATQCKGGPFEILDGGKYGALVPVGNPQKLAEAILATLRHPPDPQLLRQRSQAFVVDSIVDQYLQLFKLPLHPRLEPLLQC